MMNYDNEPEENKAPFGSLEEEVADDIPVMLSEGEYVIPADVVSHIGDGSSERGGELLDEMIANIRMMKTNTDIQPEELNETPEDIMLDLKL